MKNLSGYLLPIFILCSCANHGQLTCVVKLPKDLKESSGLVTYTENTAWGIEDSGNQDNIYKINFEGEILKVLEVKNAKNKDWEDLTKDAKGNLYIGDFGNNENRRKDLTIYKLPNPETESGDKIDAEKITFRYPEQKDFPPSKKKLVFDSEAFFHHNNHLYIFTKNRAHPFTGETWVYKVPDKKGDYKAEFIGRLKTCEDWDTCRVTSADISKDGKTIVLLGYGKLWVITDFSKDNIVQGKLREIDLGLRTQLESVCFIDKKTLLLSDEENSKQGRNLYLFELN